MDRVEGYYWVRERDEGHLIIAKFEEGEWTFGDGEYFDDESRLTVAAGPLLPPSDAVAAGWNDRYAETVKLRQQLTGKDPTGDYDYIEGYYWVRSPGHDNPILAQYMEGWGEVAREDELDEVIVLDGPLEAPQVSKVHKA